MTHIRHGWYRLLLFKCALVIINYSGCDGQVDTTGCFQCCYKGDPGIRGPPGPTGPTGPMGYNGYPGNDGQGGQPGEWGEPGGKGWIGDTGTQGYVGDIGLTGHGSGIKGNSGIKGSKGSFGPLGTTGKEGPQGSKGTKGSKGAQGDIGNPALSTRCFFSVQLNKGIFKTGENPAQIVYDTVYTNEGGNMNKATGLFTAPVNGVYYFVSTVYRQAGIEEFGVFIRKNMDDVVLMSGGSVNSTDTASASVVLSLNAAENVFLAVKENSELRLSPGQGIMFSGYIIST